MGGPSIGMKVWPHQDANYRMWAELVKVPLSSGEIEMIRHAYELMNEFTQERFVSPLQQSSLVDKYLDEFITLVEDAQDQMEDPVPLTDALAEIRCFKAVDLLPYNPNSLLQVEELVNWTHFVDPSLDAYDDDVGGPLFWQRVTGLLISARLSEAGEEVKKVRTKNHDVAAALADLCGLLITYPTNFDRVFALREWRKSALNLDVKVQELNDIEWRVSLGSVIRIITGNEGAILKESLTWYTAVTALYMYIDPLPDMLPLYFTAAQEKHPVDVTVEWEVGCAGILQRKSLEALASLERLDITLAMVTSEFLACKGAFDQYPADAKSAREALALRFAILCLSQPDLLNIGLEVLGNMGTSKARNLAESLLPEVSKQHKEYESVLELCEMLDLPLVARQICQIAAEEFMKQQQVFDSVIMYVRADDVFSARKVCWDIFELMLLERKPIGDDVTLDLFRTKRIDNEKRLAEVSSEVLDCLAPLAVLVKIMDSLESGEYDALSICLEGLLSLPNPPLQSIPLLALSIIGVGTEIGLKTITLLMTVLDSWEKAAPEIRQKGLDLITQAQHKKEWELVLDPGFSPSEVLWMLRRKLAYDVPI